MPCHTVLYGLNLNVLINLSGIIDLVVKIGTPVQLGTRSACPCLPSQQVLCATTTLHVYHHDTPCLPPQHSLSTVPVYHHNKLCLQPQHSLSTTTISSVYHHNITVNDESVRQIGSDSYDSQASDTQAHGQTP